jgi:hypothetical protein
VQVSYRFGAASAVFDDGNLVSSAGLVPVMRLAEQTGLSRPLGKVGDYRRAKTVPVSITQPVDCGWPERRVHGSG